MHLKLLVNRKVCQSYNCKAIVTTAIMTHNTVLRNLVKKRGVVHKWRNGLKGGRSIGVCDYSTSTKAFVIKIMTMGWRGALKLSKIARNCLMTTPNMVIFSHKF